MHLFQRCLLLFAVSLLCCPQASAHPFIVTKKSPPTKSSILFAQDGYTLIRAPLAKAADFTDLYWINIHGLDYQAAALAKFGKVLHWQPAAFAVMRIRPRDVARLSAELHGQKMACGAVIRLFGNTWPAKASPDPRPIIDVQTNLKEVVTAAAAVDAAALRQSVDELSALHSRYHSTPSGQTVPDVLAAMYQRLGAGRDDVTVKTVAHVETPQRSVIVKIIGQKHPEEVIILGSHIDSLNFNGPQTLEAPGSDDNASGTATNLEIFRVLMAQGFRFDRTLEFHGYAAEEVGLVGSQEIVQQYKDAGVNVVAMLQYDMNLFGEGPDKIWFVKNYTNASLNAQLSALTSRYLHVAQGTEELEGGTSDHAAWTMSGYAAAFPFENPKGWNPNIHTANDFLASWSRFSQAAEFARLGLAYALHFAGVLSQGPE